MSTRRILAALLLAAAAASAQGRGPPPVAVAPAVARKVARGRTFVASIEPVRVATVGSETDGYVQELLVREGDRMRAKAPVARLRTTTIDIRIALAQAELDLRKEELAELEAGSREEEKESARAKHRAALAELTYWEWQIQRTRRLVEANTLSEDQLRSDQRQLDAAREKVKETKADLDLVLAGPRKERIAQARARVAAQEQQVKLLRDERRKHEILAPFDGFVIEERTQEGEWLQAGNPVVRLAALKEVEVVAAVPDDAIARVELGMDVRIAVTALGDRVFSGSVTTIVPSGDRRARTFPVKIRLANPIGDDGRPLYRAGMFARVTFAVGEAEDAVLVPKDALVLGGRSPIVYALQEDGTVRLVPVELGIAEDDLIQVRGPLEPGAEVVVRGNERLRPGSPVKVVERLETEDSEG